MSLITKRGIVHLTLSIFVVLFIVLFALIPFRKYFDLAINHSAWHFGINLNDIAKDSYTDLIKNQSRDFEYAQDAVFLNEKIDYRDAVADSARVLGQQNTASGKWIEVDISDQRLNMKENDVTVGSFLVSTGKWYPTPTGTYNIWTKLRYTRMRGGSKTLGTFYDLPNVPYTMYYNKGYGIHGAYWHNNFGQPMSHGCVNMKPGEAGIVYSWADLGTKVTIHQ